MYTAPGSHEEQNVTSAPSNPGKQTSTENRLSTYNLTSHCKEPVPWKHANEKKSYQFVVGQTLQYQCLETVKYGGTAESTCMLIHGKPAWTKPHLKCTNDNSNLYCISLAVAACVFLINLIIFLVWIIWRKRWRRRRQHDKEKNKNREVRSYGKNQVADHPIGLLSA
ncbi:interleukin-2 receptor subunit alpha [Monodelphis domestica]|uniref:interleukin-2 receptor subunit alpha n=1 Tax=Monodelphis domestica TaxID=13616 RepID=UPI0024E27299|nr:interleukin-2 receptor subunit alpha [Monodelphis domestica]